MTKKEKQDLAEEIAMKVFALKEEKEVRNKEAAQRIKVWEEGTDFLVCKVCSSYKDQPNLPNEALRAKRGNIGMVARNREESNRKIKDSEVKRRMKEHEEGNFHLWCLRKSDEEKESSKTFEEENTEAGMLVIKAYLKTAAEGGSSADFLRLVNFTHLIPDILKSQKNNSQQAFFELRDDCFELVTERVQNKFRGDQVTELSATLDKVTVQSRSFTVLLTFFFSGGKIFCLLNSLLKMKQEDYDSAGTARMIVKNMRETLGLTRTQLGKALLHFRYTFVLLLIGIFRDQNNRFVCSYDGVYASPEQRVAGGGCLDLSEAVAAELGLEEGSLSGTWDFGHNLQIIWHISIKKHPTVEGLITLMFSAMDEYRTGQSSVIFRSRAVALGHLILSNKKRQTTRFVRSLQMGLQAYLRNLPTLIHVFAEKYEDAVKENRNTEATETLRMLSQLRDSRKLLLAVGLAQLLELYVVASVQSQHSRRFPTQTWSVVAEMREKVRALGVKWKWEEEELKYAGIEAPVKVKDRLVKDGLYRPSVSEASTRGSRVRRETNLVAEGGSISDLFDEEGESVIPLAGEVQMEVPLVWRLRRRVAARARPASGVDVFGEVEGEEGEEGERNGRGGATRYLTREDIKSVEDELSGLAVDIVEEWNLRQKQTPLEEAGYKAFGEKYDWGIDKVKVEMEGVEAVLGLHHARRMKVLLEDVICRLSEVQEARFDCDLMLEGFSCYLKYKTKEQAMGGGLGADHEVYEAWYKVRRWGLGSSFPVSKI